MTRLEEKISFLKSNESMVRYIYSNGFKHTHIEFKNICSMAKDQGLYSLATVPRQIYINLLNVCENNIGWDFKLKI